MTRLPTPGSDDGNWGNVLNDFLSQSHDTSGSLKPGSVGTNAIAANAVTKPKLGATGGSDGQALIVDSSKSSGMAWQTLSGGGTVPDATTSTKGIVQLAGDLAGTAAAPTVPGLATKANDSVVVHVTGNETVAGVKTFSSSPVVPTPTTATQTANKSYVDSVAGAGAADATTSTKGIVQLAGDLAGTAAAPTVPGLAAKANATDLTTHTSNVSNPHSVTKAQVGLSNVDNTSDTSKPVSTATQTALAAKANATVTVTGSQSLAGGGDISANRTLTLVNDAGTPGNSKYYGTDGGGAKGYFALPSGGGGSFATLTDGNISAPANGQKLSYNATSTKWQNTPGGIPLATVSLPGTLATGTISLAFPIIGTWLFEALVVNVGTPSTGAAIVADLQYNGTTIFGTQANRPSVAAGAYWDASGAPSVTQFTGSASTRGYLVFSLASVGSAGTEGADLVATLYASRIA